MNREFWAPRLRFGCIFLLLLLVTSIGVRLSEAQTLPERIERLLQQYHEYRLFNGSALVAEGGEIILKRSFGEADMSWHVPNTPDTKFRIGSTTKQFTATLILALVEEGMIDLDARITDYLPSYPPLHGNQVTIHHLLSHTSGIPNYTTPGFMSDAVRDPHPPDSLMALFSHMALEFDPGSRWSYSNSNFIVLGAIVEAVTGGPYEEALRQRVLDPLGLDQTGYEHNSEVLERQAVGYVKGVDDYDRAPYLDTSVPYAAGMLYSTVEDLHKWGASFYEKGPFKHAGTKNLMLSSHADLPAGLIAAAGLPPGYGYGIFVGDVAIGSDTVRVIEHGGTIFGFATGFWRMPDDRSMIILLDNSSSNSIREIGRGIMAILYGERPPAPRQPISDVVHDVIESDGTTTAITTYRNLLEDGDDRYDFSEVHLNLLGYHYLDLDETERAIAVFQLNAAAYPESPNAYDSLAEAYLKAGERELAIRNYRRVLELNPTHENAIMMLGTLDPD